MIAVNMKCQAIKVSRDNMIEVVGFVREKWHSKQEKGFKVRALNGLVTVCFGDWIVKRLDGEIEVYCFKRI